MTHEHSVASLPALAKAVSIRGRYTELPVVCTSGSVVLGSGAAFTVAPCHSRMRVPPADSQQQNEGSSFVNSPKYWAI